jgi:ketosteroid isomerase-like protein
MNVIQKPAFESDSKASMQRIEDNLRMMRTYFDALFGKNLNVILDMLDENIEWQIVPTGDTFSEEYASLGYRTAGTLTNQADFPSTNQADFLSIKFEPTGKKYEFQCSFIFHISNGKIDCVREYFDMETIKRQLGAVSASSGTQIRRGR